MFFQRRRAVTTPRKMKGWEPKNTPQLEKENQLNQTIKTSGSMLIFQGVKIFILGKWVGEMGSMFIFGGVFLECSFLLCPKHETVLQVKLSS